MTVGRPGRKGFLVPLANFLGQNVQVDTADSRRGSAEIGLDHIWMQADGLKDLGAMVALNSRNSHLRDDFDNAFDNGL